MRPRLGDHDCHQSRRKGTDAASHGEEASCQGELLEKPEAMIHPATPVRKEPDPTVLAGEPSRGEGGEKTDPGSPKFDTNSLLEEEEVGLKR